MTHSNRMTQFLVAAAVVGVVLVALGVPIGGFLPYLVFLACPLIMVFMMRGMHGGGAEHGGDHTGHARGYGHNHDANRHAEPPATQR